MALLVAVWVCHKTKNRHGHETAVTHDVYLCLPPADANCSRVCQALLDDVTTTCGADISSIYATGSFVCSTSCKSSALAIENVSAGTVIRCMYMIDGLAFSNASEITECLSEL